MWKKILVSGAVGAAILAAGGTALAASGDNSPAPSPSTPSSAPAHQKARIGATLRRTVHATWTTRKDGQFVKHDSIRGIDVAPADATTITVEAADGTTQTYAVTSSTVVTLVSAGKHTRGTIGDVHPGDAVGVLGTGSTPTATHIVDRGKPSSTS